MITPALIFGKMDSFELDDQLMFSASTLGVAVAVPVMGGQMRVESAVLGTTSSLLQNTTSIGPVELSDGNTEAGFDCDDACFAKSRIFFLHMASMCPIFLQ